MISVEKAKALIMGNCPLPEKEIVVPEDANGCILASAIIAPVNLPPFDQSAMDGFALFAPMKKKRKKTALRILYRVSGEIKAGSICKKKLPYGETFRIFTGAKTPSGANCVVKQEDAEYMKRPVQGKGNHYLKEAILISQRKIRQGDNIRTKGSHITKGDIALKRGVLLNPAAIGFLAAMGITKVPVFKSPVITIIATGSELAAPGIQLKDGKIYESNIAAITAALGQMAIKPIRSFRIADSTVALLHAVKNAIKVSDILIICGGVSVGKYDLVRNVCSVSGIREVIHGIEQKPGKPLFFGKYQHIPVFGLPGNPAAALICFYEYVYPAIRKMQGFKSYFLPTVFLKSRVPISKNDHKARFLKSSIKGFCVKPLNGQESNIMWSFANSDSLIYIHKDKKSVKKNELVEVHPLPWHDGLEQFVRNRQ